MKLRIPMVALASAWFCLMSCSKKEDVAAPSSPPAPTEAPTSGANTLVVAYQESVRAGLDAMVLNMSFVDEEKNRKDWGGTLTIVKDRFATVEHEGTLQKTVHLRRWANVYLADIPDSGQPLANLTEDSPLTGKLVVADLMDTGAWRHRPEGVAADRAMSADVARLMGELDRVESGAAMFYLNQRLEVGESWQVPIEGMARWFGNLITEFSGDINVKVDRTETFQEHLCHIFKVDLKVDGKMLDPQGQGLDVSLQGNGEIWRAKDLSLDLKADITGTAELSAKVETNAISMIVKGPLKITEERKLRKNE